MGCSLIGLKQLLLAPRNQTSLLVHGKILMLQLVHYLKESFFFKNNNDNNNNFIQLKICV